jgi:hypothetical protein
VIWLSRTGVFGALGPLSALLCVLALAGCGGGAEEPGSRPIATTGPSSASSGSSAARAAAPSQTTTGQTTTGQGNSAKAQSTDASSQGQSDVRGRADAICVRRNRELKGAPLAGAGMAATASDAARRAAIEQRALAELSALSPPAGVAAQWKTMVEQTRLAGDEVAKLAEAARTGQVDEVTRDLAAATRPPLRLLVAAAKVGARHCTVIG